MDRTKSVVTPQRFATGMTFDQYVAYVATPENFKREGSAPATRRCGSTTRRRRRSSGWPAAPTVPPKCW